MKSGYKLQELKEAAGLSSATTTFGSTYDADNQTGDARGRLTASPVTKCVANVADCVDVDVHVDVNCVRIDMKCEMWIVNCVYTECMDVRCVQITNRGNCAS